ncbi:hypothetical protein CY34DRAFT_738029 [Suillus luteus UH-Slu-Lm8-n1]|uniref:Uncharacterized protein n=1 Tax=Suillus luteus UH-Slu-Lm8-n1 TaxID=930992 RepID=A0A0D0BIQ8_9AGAM|nr:hypothetical protein CY34DRAFT_738029 [Suillus luteus UH-Slu-Lm8-n1]
MRLSYGDVSRTRAYWSPHSVRRVGPPWSILHRLVTCSSFCGFSHRKTYWSRVYILQWRYQAVTHQDNESDPSGIVERCPAGAPNRECLAIWPHILSLQLLERTAY